MTPIAHIKMAIGTVMAVTALAGSGGPLLSDALSRVAPQYHRNATYICWVPWMTHALNAQV